MEVFLFSWQKHMFLSLCSNSANSIGRKKSKKKKKKNIVCICNIVPLQLEVRSPSLP